MGRVSPPGSGHQDAAAVIARLWAQIGCIWGFDTEGGADCRSEVPIERERNCLVPRHPR